MFIIPDLFSGYMKGAELARKANWDDLNQYNTVQSNQMKNLVDLATMSPRINKFYDEEYQKKLQNNFETDIYDDKVAQSNFATLMAQLGLDQARFADPYYRQMLQGRASGGQKAAQPATPAQGAGGSTPQGFGGATPSTTPKPTFDWGVSESPMGDAASMYMTGIGMEPPAQPTTPSPTGKPQITTAQFNALIQQQCPDANGLCVASIQDIYDVIPDAVPVFREQTSTD